MKRLLLTVGLLSVLASPVAAQDLHGATAVFGAAAYADWFTTHRALSMGLHETNPMLGFTQSRPTATVLSGAAMDVAGVWIWNRVVGRQHPKIARVGLYSAAVFRGYLATRNTVRRRAWMDSLSAGHPAWK